MEKEELLKHYRHSLEVYHGRLAESVHESSLVQKRFLSQRAACEENQ